MKKAKKPWMKRLGLTIVLAGILTMLYPLTSMICYDMQSDQKMESFLEEQKAQPAKVIEQTRKLAQEYNAQIDGSAEGAVDPFDVEGYAPKPALNYKSGEIFGYISIPKIDEELPIYLGASRYHLSIGAAQIDGTSIPLGGVNTRAVIAGHRGWTTQQFFLNLDKMEPGDKIYIDALGEELEYEVYSKESILPSQYEKLAVIDGQDTLTLLTCEPYLISTHRMLVNARRVVKQPVVPAEEVLQTTETVVAVQTPEESALQQALAKQVDPTVSRNKMLLKGAVAILWVLFFLVLYRLLKTFFQRSSS